MSLNGSILDFSLEADLVAPTARLAQTAQALSILPADTTVFSVDSHWSISEDIFYEKFPARLKDRAPRVWFGDGIWHIGFDGKKMIKDAQVDGVAIFDGRPGSTQLAPRLADMDAEGVDKELVFGNTFNAMLFCPDLEIREYAVRIYNEYMAELQSHAPGRFYGVGFIDYWDLSKTQASIDEIKALGLKTFMLPLNPMKDKFGDDIEYCSVKMEPFWDIVEDSGLPLVHHIGETASKTGRNSIAIWALQNFLPFRKIFGEYTLGGILDRNPKLQIAWIESGLNWVLGCIQDASFIYTSFKPRLEYKMQREVKDYWRDNMFASFMYDPLGLELIDRIGVDKAMWANDYPHAESTLGYGWGAMGEVLKAVQPDDARKILGGNALKLFKI